jgi:hexokinase
MSSLLTYTRSPGQFHDVPKDLVKEIEQLEQLFTVDTAKLKEITDHFVKELTKGMSSRYA